MKIFKKKLTSNNPMTLKLTLHLLDITMQKCGNPMHEPVGTKDFMKALVGLLHNKQLDGEVSE